MAGGITSGIIYPGAVARIAERFAFRSIGGTSVGAIAAAVAAAAEYGRRTGDNPNAFESIVAGIPQSLGDQASDKHSRLFHLFTAEAGTQPLLTLVMPLFQGGSMVGRLSGVLMAALSAAWIALPVLIATIIGLILVMGLLWLGHGMLALIALPAVLTFILAVWLVALFVMLQYRWLPGLQKNGYGVCTGQMAPTVKEDASKLPFEGLTAWIHRMVQTAAGRKITDDPLTFGDLWNCPGKKVAASTAPPDPEQVPPRTIDLAMIVSDISRHRAMQLPFLEFPTPVYVEVEELKRYYPDSIVNWMVANKGVALPDVETPDGTIRLPEPANIPVVFGARLSLSFPILLTAVRLRTPDFLARKNGGKAPLRDLWLSDGGLISNFPIHFFDSPIPTRPTFCLNLVDYGSEVPADDGNAAQAPVGSFDETRLAKNRKPQPAVPPGPGNEVWKFVTMISGNRFLPPPFTDFDAKRVGMVGFLGTLVNTARVWSDNQLLLAPGVRERVVNIALKSDEGGLNLDMKPDVLLDLDYRGQAAGLLIAARFDPSAQTDPSTGEEPPRAFINHRWVRYRNFMGAFEDLSRRYVSSLDGSEEAARQRGEPLLENMVRGEAEKLHGYDLPDHARGYFLTYTDELRALALRMAAATRSKPVETFDQYSTYADGRTVNPPGAAPRPKMRLQLRPLTGNDPAAERADLPAPPPDATPLPQTP
ncbi:RpoH suppressor [Labrys miyagiensis]|uniref:RpoH suppressor n=2 Tax=Labrys miyagiensis TaxID=346912 RepID=A0ABQ6CBX1_9HYPH|nr:RpoH suppressor [Labrys miyagiensis]